MISGRFRLDTKEGRDGSVSVLVFAFVGPPFLEMKEGLASLSAPDLASIVVLRRVINLFEGLLAAVDSGAGQSLWPGSAPPMNLEPRIILRVSRYLQRVRTWESWV